MKNSIPRPEYPRPQEVRADWANLNGVWEFEFDQSNSGEYRGLQNEDAAYSEKITVLRDRAQGLAVRSVV